MNQLRQRFYDLPVTAEIEAAITENLTNHEEPDLVVAHLSRNWSYFGAIDKTLTGFVILDNEGDNYYLLDLRGSGQVYFQDHETRELSLHFDTLADYVAYKADKNEDSEARLAAYQTQTERPGRDVSSATLNVRSQWLVHTLAQFMMHHGKPMSSAEELARNGAGHFQHLWPTVEKAEAAFRAELTACKGEIGRAHV
jgi:hypothetical protein